MSTSVSLNGSTNYAIPAVGEDSWGTDVTNYLIAIAANCLATKGGSVTLLADADFGANYGLKSTYYKSRGTVATAGIVRLANDESVGWRNAANSANKLLKVNSSNVLEFDGAPILTLALGSANTALRMNSGGTAYEWAALTNANIDASAAIAVSKLAALTASRAVVSDASGFLSASATTSAEIGYLSGTTSPTGTGALVRATSPTLVTPVLGVATATSINKVALTAPATGSTLTIADGKTLTASNTLTFTGTDGSSAAFGTGGTVAYTGNKLSAFAATTSAELAGTISDETGTGALVFANSPALVSPVITSGATVRGDLLLQNTSGSQPTLQLSEDPDNGTNKVTLQAPATLAADYTLTLPADDGNAGEVLTTDGSGGLSWAAALTNALTSAYIFVGNGSNVATATAVTGDVTISNAGVTAIAAGAIVNADINGSAAIEGSKIASASAAVAGVVNTAPQSFAGVKTFEGQLIGKGTATNDNAAEGYIGQYGTDVDSAATNVGATATYTNFASLSLSAGDWDISGVVVYTLNGATMSGGVDLYLSLYSGTTTTDRAIGDNHVSGPVPTASYDISLAVPAWRVSSGSSFTVYLKGRCSYSAGTPQEYCRLSARRVR